MHSYKLISHSVAKIYFILSKITETKTNSKLTENNIGSKLTEITVNRKSQITGNNIVGILPNKNTILYSEIS